jgi:hypothetical protein
MSTPKFPSAHVEKVHNGFVATFNFPEGKKDLGRVVRQVYTDFDGLMEGMLMFSEMTEVPANADHGDD